MQELDRDRLLKVAALEIERQVADIFKAARNQPCVLCEIPIIGRVLGCDYSPHAPRQQTFFIERLVVKALLAREWFKLYEAPPWAGPLPLCEQEYSACFESGERRPLLVGLYGQHLRGYDWEVRNVTPFEVFCAESLRG